MTPDKSLRALFDQALDCEDAAERASFLEAACGADTALRQRLEALLRAHTEAGGFLSDPARRPADWGGASDSLLSLPTEKAGDRIGRYKLLEQIGEGGCGVVYMAEQEEPIRRRVAIKIIKLGMDSKQVVARFEAERQALALMEHPNIARVLDGGATESGRPFFVMELVRGVKLTEFCDHQRLPPSARLELFIQVCSAVQHAHQKGIIHRDLKPSNILVTMIDGEPVPKVIDFGIAKATGDQRLTEKTLFTAFAQFIGTPAYMSPEQAEMSGVDIDTRADIYSLGVVLYELLTGKTPFDAHALLRAGVDEIRRTIREQEPATPSKRISALASAEATTVAKARQMELPALVRDLRGDLDWIVMKCLEKDRNRRYETPNDLALDVRRYLDSEPVSARPASRLYRLQKLFHRNQLAFGASATLLLVLVGGIGASSWQAIRATRAEQEQTRLRQKAEDQERKAQKESTRSAEVARLMKEMLKGVGPAVARGRDTVLLREILDEAAKQVKELKGQPEVEADLLSTLGNVFLDLNELTNAAAMHQKALELRKNLYGPEHLDVAASLSSLGAVVCATGGEAPKAEAIHRQVLAMRRKLLGDEHLEVAASLQYLAQALRLQSRYSEAIEAEVAALQIKRKLLGNEHLSVAQSLNLLGTTIYTAGKAEEAEPLLREALELRRRLIGNDNLAVAAALDDLAWALSAQGKYAEAEQACRDGLALHKKWLGDTHQRVAGSLQNLGAILREQGQLKNAEATFREALAMDRKLFPSPHVFTANTLLNLASTLRAEGQPAEAEAMYREALGLQRQLFGDASPRIASSLSFLALALLEQGKRPEAEAACREALAIRARLPESMRLAHFALRNLVRVCEALGDPAGTESLKRELSQNERARK